MKKIEYIMCEERLWDVPSDPVAFIRYWIALARKLPSGAEAPSIELACDDDYGVDFVACTLKYEREETPEEVEHRARVEAQYADAAERHEREQLEKLKAKYEND